jgi:hypothetical protein
MPLTEKGQKILAAMVEKHGKEEGTRIFYASKNAGRITGVDSKNDADDKKDEEVKETPTKETKTVTKEPAEEKKDPKTALKTAETELKALEREQEQSEQRQGIENNIDDQKTAIRQLRNEMRETEHKERMGIADATEKAEYEQDAVRLIQHISDAVDRLAARMDAFEH